MLLSLLRMIEVQGLILIDGLDISHLSGDDLRSRLNVLPQEPVFLPGTIGANLDVRGLCLPAAIHAAVEKVGLRDKVRDSGGIDADLDPTEWSQGEKQLLCLARALLTPSKVLILDEATSRYVPLDIDTTCFSCNTTDMEWMLVKLIFSTPVLTTRPNQRC
jgi:ATP-binding cassette, subfamily C (CFTR/MRP), member 1